MYKYIISGANLSVVTNNFLIGLIIHTTRDKSCLVLKPSKLLRASEVMDFRKESTITNFLEQHNSLP